MDIKTYLEKLIVLLPEDHRDSDYFINFLDNYRNAKELADTDEKKALLEDTITKVAHQLTFIAFRDEFLTDDLAKVYRTLPKPEETSKALEEAHQARKDRYEELRKMNQAAQDEQDEIDIFQRVLGGMSKEDAEARLAEYKQLAEQKQAGGR